MKRSSVGVLLFKYKWNHFEYNFGCLNLHANYYKKETLKKKRLANIYLQQWREIHKVPKLIHFHSAPVII